MSITNAASLLAQENSAAKAAKEDISPDWARICEGTRYSKIIPFPRKGADGEPVCYLRVRNLTVIEANSANAIAHQKAVDSFRRADPDYKGPIDTTAPAFRTAFDNASAIEQIKIQCRTLEDPSKPFFPPADPKHARSAAENVLSMDEVAALMQQCLIVRNEQNPLKYEMTDEQILQLVERARVSENPDFFWSFVSLDLAIPLVRRLVFLLSTSRASSSDSSQPSEALSSAGLSKSESSA